MITFQSIMFVSLGFLAAVLLGFVIMPAFWARAVRLTSERMRASLPLTEREIKAEHNRLRAENAIRIYRLSAERDKAKRAEARRTVEVNRRDAAIGDLERQLNRVQTEHDASENARRVLEATLKERMPELEKRLVEARQLLAHRDGEMKALREDASKTFRALDEAMQANAQQRSEIERLKTSLAAHSGRPASPPEGVETEQALRSELEGLRVRTRDQADLIKRLQKMIKTGERLGEEKLAAGASLDEEQRVAELAAVQEGLEASREALLAQVRTLSEKVETQAGEISNLKRDLMQAEAGAGGGVHKRGRAGDKAALGARIAAKDDEIAERDKTIAALRREIASANERLAKQAAYYMGELRRLGPGGTGRTRKWSSGGAAAPSPAAEDGVSGVKNVLAATAEGDDRAAFKELAEAQTPRRTSTAGARADLKTRLEDAEAALDAAETDADPIEAREGERPKLVERIAGLSKR